MVDVGVELHQPEAAGLRFIAGRSQVWLLAIAGSLATGTFPAS